MVFFCQEHLSKCLWSVTSSDLFLLMLQSQCFFFHWPTSMFLCQKVEKLLTNNKSTGPDGFSPSVAFFQNIMTVISSILMIGQDVTKQMQGFCGLEKSWKCFLGLEILWNLLKCYTSHEVLQRLTVLCASLIFSSDEKRNLWSIMACVYVCVVVTLCSWMGYLKEGNSNSLILRI